MAQPFHLLFICAGNTCRSPMAQGMLQQLLERRLGSEADMFRVDSAGIGGRKGSPAARQAVRVLKRRGIDLTGHASKRVTEDIARGADLILTMSKGQRDAVGDISPAAEGRVFTLKEFVAACESRRGDLAASGGSREMIREALVKGIDRAAQLRKLGEAIEEIGGKLTSTLRKGGGLDRSHLGTFDIADPFGGSAADYESCAQEIEELLERLVEYLAEGADETGRGRISGETAP